MAYCTYEDVQRNLQYLQLKSDSKPSIEDVATFCGEVAADLDSHLEAAGVMLPVSDPDRLMLLKKIAVDGVTAKVFRSFNTEQALENAKAYQTEYDKAVANIIEHPGIIDNQQVAASPGYNPHAAGRKSKYRREMRDW